MSIVLDIGDTHFPFAHKDTFPFLQAAADRFGPTHIVHKGDLLDFHALSDYDPDPDGDGPGKEFLRGMRYVRRFWELFPTGVICTSNHDARPFRRAYKAGIPTNFMRPYREWLEMPAGWEIGPRFVIDDVVHEHGEGQTGQYGHIKAALGNMQSTSIGHIHAHAGINYVANPKHLIFGFNVGCLIDKDAYAMAYGKHLKAKPTIGVGVITDGIPMWVPMSLRKSGRWSGRL